MSEETPAPPLADTADPGYAERLAKLRNRAEAIIKADPVPGSRADREEDRDIKEALRQRAETHPEDPQPDMFTACDATIKNGFDETVRCGLPAGHALNRGSDDPGVGGFYDHTGQTAAKKLLWWRDTAADAVPSTFPAGNPGGDPLPQREPGAALNCTSVSALASAGAPFARGVLGSPGVMRIPDDPKPVRVRFVDLPHRNVPREVFGAPAHTIEPGGFALVVDRFSGMVRLNSEREHWEAFGATIGAATVLLYPGELDIVDYLAE